LVILTVNERIVKAAVAAANKRIPNLPQESGYCLKFVRMVVEWGLFDGRAEFYKRFLVAGTSGRGSELTPAQRLAEARQDPYAADMEASAKALGWAIPSAFRRAGDLVFDHNAAKPVGHVGVLIGRGMVLEQIHPKFRPTSIHLGHGSLSVTPYAARPWTLVARVRE